MVAAGRVPISACVKKKENEKMCFMKGGFGKTNGYFDEGSAHRIGKMSIDINGDRVLNRVGFGGCFGEFIKVLLSLLGSRVSSK